MSWINDQRGSVQVITSHCSLGRIAIWHARTPPRLSLCFAFCAHHFPARLSAGLSCSCYLTLSSSPPPPLLQSTLPPSPLILNLSPPKLTTTAASQLSKLPVSLGINIKIKMKFEVTLAAANRKYNIPLCCLGMFGGDIMTAGDFLQRSWCANLSWNDTLPFGTQQPGTKAGTSPLHSAGAKDVHICV